MIIYKSNDIERWNEAMLSDVAGRKFYCMNPQTGVKDIGFEFERKVPDMLNDMNKSETDMFEEIWRLQEDYAKMDEVHDFLIRKYNLSIREIQNLLKYLCLSLPRNENGNSINLKTWKRNRNKIQIQSEFARQANEDYDASIYNYDYFMKQCLNEDNPNWQRFLSIIDSGKLDHNVLSSAKIQFKGMPLTNKAELTRLFDSCKLDHNILSSVKIPFKDQTYQN